MGHGRPHLVEPAEDASPSCADAKQAVVPDLDIVGPGARLGRCPLEQEKRIGTGGTVVRQDQGRERGREVEPDHGLIDGIVADEGAVEATLHLEGPRPLDDLAAHAHDAPARAFEDAEVELLQLAAAHDLEQDRLPSAHGGRGRLDDAGRVQASTLGEASHDPGLGGHPAHAATGLSTSREEGRGAIRERRQVDLERRGLSRHRGCLRVLEGLESGPQVLAAKPTTSDHDGRWIAQVSDVFGGVLLDDDEVRGSSVPERARQAVLAPQGAIRIPRGGPQDA